MGVAYQNGQAANGTVLVTAPAGPGVTWNLTALSVSMAGPASSGNPKVTVYDGTVAAGTVIHAEFLPSPTGSVGTTHECKIPKGPGGNPALQGTPGNAMNIVVNGTGPNQVSVNARFTDGLSQ